MIADMSIALRKPMTLDEFLEWEERQELRYAFDGFQPVAMTGGTVEPGQITFNVRKSLDTRLAGKQGRPFGPKVKILVDGRARYPDAFVTCKPVRRGATVIGDPVTVFEVASGGNSDTDFIDKNQEYRAPRLSSATSS
jgi:Uma2 family endonuclease